MESRLTSVGKVISLGAQVASRMRVPEFGLSPSSLLSSESCSSELSSESSEISAVSYFSTAPRMMASFTSSIISGVMRFWNDTIVLASKGGS
ncbi:MAG: hypothetical protein GXZ13_08045 [Synergistaceae bacterium]|nr:hypothetical protein [Synergistaceae bacterium]